MRIKPEQLVEMVRELNEDGSLFYEYRFDGEDHYIYYLDFIAWHSGCTTNETTIGEVKAFVKDQVNDLLTQ